MSQYPCFNQAPDSDCALTPTYEARECVSYVAWRGSLILGHEWPRYWGSALTWPENARSAGFQVNTTPEANCIMALAPNVNGAGKVGHVGWVVSVETQTVVVQEYDFLVRFGYDERDFPIAGAQFIHLPQPPHPTPEPTPIPNPATEDDMQPVIVNVNAAIGSYLLFPNGEYVGIASGPDLTAFASLGYKQITVSPTQHQRLVAAAPNNAGANA